MKGPKTETAIFFNLLFIMFLGVLPEEEAEDGKSTESE
jgi:hypothetical protein